jgi:hypothetical protein
MTTQHWIRKEGGGLTVTVQMYHNWPPQPHIGETGPGRNVWMMQAWNTHMVASAFEASGCGAVHPGDHAVDPQDTVPYVKAYHAATASNTGHAPPMEDTPDMDVFWLMGSEKDLRELADWWSAVAIADAATVSGDDSYFDYYPDYLSGLHQLCVALDYPDAINKAVNAALEGSYANDEEAADLLPSLL